MHRVWGITKVTLRVYTISPVGFFREYTGYVE